MNTFIIDFCLKNSWANIKKAKNHQKVKIRKIWKIWIYVRSLKLIWKLVLCVCEVFVVPAAYKTSFDLLIQLGVEDVCDNSRFLDKVKFNSTKQFMIWRAVSEWPIRVEINVIVGEWTITGWLTFHVFLMQYIAKNL